MPHIHQYRVHIIYKAGPDLYILDRLSQNSHTRNRHQEITGININVHAISTLVSIPACTSKKDIQGVPSEDSDLQRLKSYIIQGWPHRKDEVKQSIKHYWPSRHKLSITDGIDMKGRRMIITFLLQRQIQQQLHSNHMGIKKMRLLVQELVYWVNMNADIEDTIKQCTTYLEYQQTQPHEKTIPHKVPCRPWEMVGADICFV